MSSNPPIARRQFVRATLGALAAAPFTAGVFAQDSGGLTDSIEFKRLVAANRILAREEIVDAFGHVSIRDPENPRRYVMARSRSPELVERLLHDRGKALDVADRVESDLVVEDLRALVDQEVAKELHEPGDLVDRALPVVRRERITGERLDAALARRARDVTDRLGPGPVALEARLAVALSPAPIPIHD